VGYLIVAIVAIAVAVFAMQNTTPVLVKFLAWELPDLPVAAIILASLGAGIVIAGLPLSYQLWRARSRARSMQARPATPPDVPREPGSPRPPRGDAP
jgi:uncharacterized integral membrane protein